ncbi:MAG: hypothetical protein DI551_02225 [Micavibrio aeruginosavorus]|uniref:BZIP domain-containing protein n=1 Tax=Micavibrio aeruginosavorus TaxID=349221 RepID=A0A2W5PZT2_9BACT|nr:MAG: hypothetical protein DI551_02225 [Micavibrio aeruginosavorus]
MIRTFLCLLLVTLALPLTTYAQTKTHQRLTFEHNKAAENLSNNPDGYTQTNTRKTRHERNKERNERRKNRQRSEKVNTEESRTASEDVSQNQRSNRQRESASQRRAREAAYNKANSLLGNAND